MQLNGCEKPAETGAYDTILSHKMCIVIAYEYEYECDYVIPKETEQ